MLLSRDEALCTLLALAVSERLGFPMFAAEIARARRRIADAFPAAERRRIAPLRERIYVGAPASAAVRASYRDPAPVPLRQLQVAFVEERVVRATYEREDGTRTERLLEPHVLLIDWPAWYLVAHDRTRDAPRTFRLDRFVAVVPDADTFRPRAREMVDAALSGSGVAVERV